MPRLFVWTFRGHVESNLSSVVFIFQASSQSTQALKFTTSDSCDRIKDEFQFLQAQYHRYTKHSQNTTQKFQKYASFFFLFYVCLFSKDALSGSKLTVKTFIMFQKISSLIINTVWIYYLSKNPGGKMSLSFKTNMKRNNGFQHY